MQFHITQMVYFLRIIFFLHVSGPNDYFCIRNCHRDERIRLIIHMVLVPGHCLLFYFSMIFLPFFKFS